MAQGYLNLPQRVALRYAGYNNVDLASARKLKTTVMRVRGIHIQGDLEANLYDTVEPKIEDVGNMRSVPVHCREKDN
jgi:hypothetical protein